jgi:hypothetical protein
MVWITKFTGNEIDGENALRQKYDGLITLCGGTLINTCVADARTQDPAWCA